MTSVHCNCKVVKVSWLLYPLFHFLRIGPSLKVAIFVDSSWFIDGSDSVRKPIAVTITLSTAIYFPTNDVIRARCDTVFACLANFWTRFNKTRILLLWPNVSLTEHLSFAWLVKYLAINQKFTVRSIPQLHGKDTRKPFLATFWSSLPQILFIQAFPK